MGIVSEETEVKFGIPVERAHDIASTLVPPSRHINMDGVALRLSDADLKHSVHLFTTKTGNTGKTRIKIERDEGKIVTILEHKTFVDGRVYEEIVERSTKPKKILKMLNANPNLLAALIKERLTLYYYTFVDGVKRELEISIDRMRTFNPANLSSPSPSPELYYLDFEGRGDGFEKEFVNSKYFKQNLSRHLRVLDIDDTRWRLGHRISGGGTIAWSDMATVEGFFDNALKILNPREVQSAELEPKPSTGTA